MGRKNFGLERESLINTYQYLHPEVLSKALGLELYSPKLEFGWLPKKVDICLLTKNTNIKVFVEVQTDNSFKVHCDKVKEIIAMSDNIIVVWEALGLSSNMSYVKKIEDITKSTHSVEFFAFDINPSYVDLFDALKTDVDWQKGGEILNSIGGLDLLRFVFHQGPKYNLKPYPLKLKILT